MTTGLSSKLNILQESPLDYQHLEPREVPAKAAAAPNRWVASRYNVQTTTEDGRLIVWNTFKGTISAFPSEQRDTVRSLLTRRGCAGSAEGLLGYLHERGLLVPEGTDEYKLFQHIFGRQHFRQDTLELILLASEDCNFRCKYCYEDFARGTMKPQVRESIKKLVTQRLPGLRNLTVSWFGGEPLYGWPAIEDLGPFFRRVATENALSFGSNMTTNGYLFTPDVAEKLLSWGVSLYQITIDGNPEDHNRNRPGRNGEPTFDTILRNLQAVRRLPQEYRIEIRVNFDPENRSGLNDFVDLLGKEFGGDPRFRLRLRAVGRWGGSNDDNFDVCGREEIRETTHQLIEQAGQKGLLSADDIREARGFGSSACYAARPYNFIIGADGHVMKCTVELDKKDRNVVGRLSEDGVLTLDNAKMALWTEPAYSSDSGCQKCVLLPNCQGIACPLIRIEDDRSPCISLKREAKQGLLLTDRFRPTSPKQRVVKRKPA
jgi:uncharacterized protein